MLNQLQKVINLIKKTGDRIMVFDNSQPDNVYVVMALKDYENLVLSKSEVRGLTEDELLDKINRDIAIWKSEQDFNADSAYPLKQAKARGYQDNIASMDLKNIIMEQQYKKDKKAPPVWSIPDQRKLNAEEVIEEDRQYLEEVIY